MPVSFVQRGSEQRLSIENGQIAVNIQPEHVGNWKHIRVGMLFALTTDLAYLNPPPIFMGLCHGTTNKYFSSSTDHAVGFITNENTSSWSWWWSASLHKIQIPQSECNFSKKENSIKTNYSLAGGNTTNPISISGVILQGGGVSSHHEGLFLDLKKSGTDLNATITFSTLTNQGISRQSYELCLNNLNIPTNYLNGYQNGIITNFDEDTYGALDTVNVGWYSADYNLEISEVSYAVFE